MPDNFAKVQPGDDLTISAPVWNAMVDAAQAQKGRQHDRLSDAQGQIRSGDIVRVKNDSGRNLARNSVLGLSGPIFTPTQSLDAFLREVTFRGVIPSATHRGKFAILLDPALAGSIARAYVAGVAPVRVNVTDTALKCADIVAGETSHLQTADDGTAQILWKQADGGGYGSSTGEQWGIVRFGTACGGDSTAAAQARCDCPDDGYEVDVSCGDCGIYYGGAMPKVWHLTILSGETPPYGMGYGYCDDGIACETLKNKKIPMRNETVPGGYYGPQPTCAWSGLGPSCLSGELALEGANWKVTILDKEDCVIAILRKPVEDFDCCGPNTGWTLDHSSACIVTISVAPDPCTCCPTKGAKCPPTDRPICDDVECCVDTCACGITVTIAGLQTDPGVICTLFDDPCYTLDGEPCPAPVGDPGRLSCYKTLPGPTPDKACGGMNGVISMAWEANCTWKFKGKPAGSGVKTQMTAKLSMSGRTLVLELFGIDGQTATFRLDNWDCGTVAILPLVGGSCLREYATTPTATLFICEPIY